MNLTARFTILSFTLLLSFNTLANSISNTSLPENTGLVKAGDKLVTLLGHQVSIGDNAPNFKVVDEQFSPVQLTDFANNTILISVVPSLDTGVCSLQTKRFNEEASSQPNNITLLTISNDLPFAQKRFCKNEHVDKIKVLSDSVWRDFGSKYGLIIKDMGLLTRAIFIIAPDGKIAYKELVSDISQHPNYEQALTALKNISSTPDEKSLPSSQETLDTTGNSVEK